LFVANLNERGFVSFKEWIELGRKKDERLRKSAFISISIYMRKSR
jgi:hypothetical protein